MRHPLRFVAAGWAAALLSVFGVSACKGSTEVPTSGVRPSASLSAALNDRYFGMPCKPIAGTPAGTCSIAYVPGITGFPAGCEFLHTDGAFMFQCDPDSGWKLVGRYVDSGNPRVVHLGVYRNGPYVVGDGGGWADRITG